ncbi:MAG: TetR/AcrR family transcriptional regulator [Syntrophobacteraceae bacterium]|jgi:AcrR family transcriptional regulator|nr:TetR/AcrR family transcriptional regulator [Syntrophobacteraceae bacterium]
MEPREVFKKLESDKRQRIFDAAIDEFADQGYKQASVNRMVQRLGIAKGSMFQYFGTKEGLFGFIFDQAVELVRRTLRQVKKDTAEADFFERIRRSLIQGVRFIDEHPRVYQVYLKMIFQEDFPLRAQFLQKVHLFSAEYLQPMVEAGMARGELRGDLDVKSTVFFLDALMDRFLQAYSVSFLDAGAGFYRAPASEIELRAGDLVSLLRHGLASGQRP